MEGETVFESQMVDFLEANPEKLPGVKKIRKGRRKSLGERAISFGHLLLIYDQHPNLYSGKRKSPSLLLGHLVGLGSRVVWRDRVYLADDVRKVVMACWWRCGRASPEAAKLRAWGSCPRYSSVRWWH